MLERVEVVYEAVPGWKTPTTGIRKYQDLPKNARAYVELIQERAGVIVRWIGVGQARDAIISNTIS